MTKKLIENPTQVVADEATHAADLAYRKLARAKLAVEVGLEQSVRLHELVAAAQLEADEAEKARQEAVAAAQADFHARYGTADSGAKISPKKDPEAAAADEVPA
jgi:hypothetical protein